MDGAALAPDTKRTSVLRRVLLSDSLHYVSAAGLEGDVCAFELPAESSPIVAEAVSGRSLMLTPGDIFLGTAGYRESTRWVVGGIPIGGLVPDNKYWVLAQAGIVGDLVGESPREKGHLGQVKYLGIVHTSSGQRLNIRQFATNPTGGSSDYGAPLFVVLGTSAEVGKTTAGIAINRSLRQKGYGRVIALKATGTSSLGELLMYLDFGVAEAFDCVDFGLPTTYPSDRVGIENVFKCSLDFCLSMSADAVLIECGGDILGANVPVFLKCLREKRSNPKIILAAADALAALGAKLMLQEMDFSVNLITGLCTDTPTLRQRTEKLCGIPAVNMARHKTENTLF
jgi:hypothetical protein